MLNDTVGSQLAKFRLWEILQLLVQFLAKQIAKKKERRRKGEPIY